MLYLSVCFTDDVHSLKLDFHTCSCGVNPVRGRGRRADWTLAAGLHRVTVSLLWSAGCSPWTQSRLPLWLEPHSDSETDVKREREVLVTDVQTVVLPPAKWRTDDSGREEMTLAVSWSGTLSSEEGWVWIHLKHEGMWIWSTMKYLTYSKTLRTFSWTTDQINANPNFTVDLVRKRNKVYRSVGLIHDDNSHWSK